MNIFQRLYCRSYQKIVFAFSFTLKFNEPELHEGAGCLKDIPLILSAKNRMHPLILTDPGIYKLGLHSPLLKVLDDAKISYELYHDVIPNPTFDVVEAAYKMFRDGNCDCLIALGGGSTMDTAKAVGARFVNPHRSLQQLKGLLKVRHNTPLMIAIPTTAGTGSEATLAAVVVNPKTKDKFSINDPHLIPEVAVLDNSLLRGLPPSVIAMTGVDALTHAIESYIGHSSTKKSKECALKAMALIQKNLVLFYQDASNEKAREGMQKAAYLAGVSFTRAYVGYVHALAHALGGFYNVPHGLANAILLPYVLKAYGKSAYKRLAEIADYLELSSPSAPLATKANAVIAYIESLNASLGIPKTFAHVIKPEDLVPLSQHAAKEGNPLYPVPKELSAKQLRAIYQEADPQ
jgi:alcohol dehydrogenase